LSIRFRAQEAAILILLARSPVLTAPSNPGGDIASQKDTFPSSGLIGRERVHWPAIFTGLKEVSLAECAPARMPMKSRSTANANA
jgi:hypothetical protein